MSSNSSNSSNSNSSNSRWNKLFSAGLGRSGRIGAWIVAVIGAGAWIAYENRVQPVIAVVDRSDWNKNKKNTSTNATLSSPSQSPQEPPQEKQE